MDMHAARLAIARIRAASAYQRAFIRLNGTCERPISLAPEGADALESINGACIAADEATDPEAAERAALRAELESYEITGAMDTPEVLEQYQG